MSKLNNYCLIIGMISLLTIGCKDSIDDPINLKPTISELEINPEIDFSLPIKPNSIIGTFKAKDENLSTLEGEVESILLDLKVEKTNNTGTEVFFDLITQGLISSGTYDFKYWCKDQETLNSDKLAYSFQVTEENSLPIDNTLNSKITVLENEIGEIGQFDFEDIDGQIEAIELLLITGAPYLSIGDVIISMPEQKIILEKGFDYEVDSNVTFNIKVIDNEGGFTQFNKSINIENVGPDGLTSNGNIEVLPGYTSNSPFAFEQEDCDDGICTNPVLYTLSDTMTISQIIDFALFVESTGDHDGQKGAMVLSDIADGGAFGFNYGLIDIFGTNEGLPDANGGPYMYKLINDTKIEAIPLLRNQAYMASILKKDSDINPINGPNFWVPGENPKAVTALDYFAQMLVNHENPNERMDWYGKAAAEAAID